MGLACSMFTSPLSALADVTVSSLFGDNMVLQRDMQVPIWGRANPGEEISVEFDGQNKRAIADSNGSWMVKLDPLNVGPERELKISGKNLIEIKNVIVGDVWLASGQSNMAFQLEKSEGGKEATASANDPLFRAFTVKVNSTLTPAPSVDGKWNICSPESVRKWSAVAFYFGTHIRKDVNVPIGLIQSYLGGTPIEAWSPDSIMAGDPYYTALKEKWTKELEKFEAGRHLTAEERKVENEARREGTLPAPSDPSRKRPTSLYNGMIHPLVPYAIKGVIWYQGEDNAWHAREYAELFPKMIRSWREAWNQGDFPFYFVQLPNWKKVSDKPEKSLWAELREAQAKTLSVTNTGMAVTIDVGMEKNIHPVRKEPVGKRLALIAEAKTYGKDVVHSGPSYERHEISADGKIKIFFKNAEGLEARSIDSSGQTVSPDFPVQGFAICGEDKKWVWAKAALDGQAVIVWSDEVKKPLHVRYAWADNPPTNLYNGAGLPAEPFRTDKD